RSDWPIGQCTFDCRRAPGAQSYQRSGPARRGGSVRLGSNLTLTRSTSAHAVPTIRESIGPPNLRSPISGPPARPVAVETFDETHLFFSPIGDAWSLAQGG